MIGLSAFVAASALVGPFEDIERITPEVAAERAAQCGVGTVTFRYEEELQSDILTISGATAATDEQLACVDKAAGWGIFVELSPDLQRRFDAIREARASALAVADARSWLSARGLLDRVPKYVEGSTDDAVFVQQVEQLCGPKAKGAFKFQYGRYVLNPEWADKMGMPPKSEDSDALTCLSHVTTIAGFKFWIIGNEAYVRK